MPNMHGPHGGAGVEKAKNFKKSMGGLLNYIKKYIPLMVVALIMAVGAVILNIITPDKLGSITTQIENDLKAGGPIDLKAVAAIGVTLIIIFIAAVTLHYGQSFIMTTVTQRLSQRFRSDIDGKVNRLPLSYFDKRTFGDVLSRVTNDVDTIGQTLNQSVVTLITSITMIIGLLIMMFISCWQLGLVVVCTVPISLIFIMLVVKKSQKYFIQVQRSLGDLNGHIEEIYAGHTVVKAYNAEKQVTEKFTGINNTLKASAWRSQFLSGMMQPIMIFVGNLGFVAVCVVGGILFLRGTIEIGDIIAFVMYARMFSNPLGQLAQIANSLQSTAAAAERVFEFLEEPEMEPDRVKTKLETVKGDVDFSHVEFSYDKGKPIIKDFSAHVKAGQKVAIVGPTGAGKTTLVNLLMRFYEIDGGSIAIDGVDIRDISRANVHDLFGMVLQDTWLFEGTVKDNIVYSKNASDEEIKRACELSGIDYLINALPGGYDMKLDDDANLSAGQKQLLTIARAMVENAPMLILDEATSSVDTRTEFLIQQAIDKMTAGRTSFIIAHRLSTIRNADLILVMKEGDIVEQGNHNELLAKNGFYAELYNSQFEQVG